MINITESILLRANRPPAENGTENNTVFQNPEWEKARKALEKVQGEGGSPAASPTKAQNTTNNSNQQMQNDNVQNPAANLYYQQYNMYFQQQQPQ